MRILVRGAIAVIAAGCRLDPLVDDIPGDSAHLLPSGTLIPSAGDSSELSAQIALNDGVDDAALRATGGVVTRGRGLSNGEPVRFWSFGAATPAPSPLYLVGEVGDAGFTSFGHPGLFDAVPGDPGYSPLHTVFEVVVTAEYDDQLITTPEALADAIELGLVEEPRATGTTVISPIVLPGTLVEVDDDASPPPMPALDVFAHGHVVGMFRFGGDRGVQPVRGLQPSNHVSFLREASGVSYDASRPIFQAAIPTEARPSYTALSVVVLVDLAPGVAAEDIDSDADLFVRGPDGSIVATLETVARFQISAMSLLLPLQFAEGAP
jgi:hypothetical protein